MLFVQVQSADGLTLKCLVACCIMAISQAPSQGTFSEVLESNMVQNIIAYLPFNMVPFDPARDVVASLFIFSFCSTTLESSLNRESPEKIHAHKGV